MRFDPITLINHTSKKICNYFPINDTDMYMHAHNPVNIWLKWEKKKKDKKSWSIILSHFSVSHLSPISQGKALHPGLRLFCSQTLVYWSKGCSVSIHFWLSSGHNNFCSRLPFIQASLDIYSFSVQKLCLGRKCRFHTFLHDYQVSDSLTGSVTLSLAGGCPTIIDSPIM